MYRRRSRKEFHLVYGKEKKKITPEMVKEIMSWIFYTIVAVIMAYIVYLGFGKSVQNIGDSMVPALQPGCNVLINRFSTYFSGPGRGDIVAFLPNGNTQTHYYIKRVVGLPGEKVRIDNGVLYINGKEQELDTEAYDKMEEAGIADTEIKLGSDEYFVLGDNRNSSEDSRSANIGLVRDDMILGKVWYSYGNADGSSGFVHNNYLEEVPAE